MKVKAITSLHTPHIGGVETMVTEMGRALRNEGHDASVLTKRWPDSLPIHERIDGMDVDRVPAGISDSNILETAQYIANNHSLIENADVLHLVGMRRPLPLIIAAAGVVYEKPVVSSVVGLEIPNPQSNESDELWQQGEHYMHDAYDNILGHTAVSASTLDLTLKVVPSLKERMSVLPAGIDMETYEKVAPVTPLKDEAPFIFSLRRLEETKGIDVLIKAYARLLEAGDAGYTKLVIAGDGPERENLEQLARQLIKKADMVKFIGSVSLEAGMGMLKTAQMTVVPSLAEAGGLVNTEANAVGCPLIASNVGGIGEYTTPAASLLVKPGDERALCEAMRTMLTDNRLRSRVVAEGRKFAATRDWSEIIQQYIELYEKATPVPRTLSNFKSDIGKKVISIFEGESEHV